MTFTFTDFDKAKFKAKSKKNCKKGMPCGFGCISKTKKCKKQIFGGGGGYADHITNPDNLADGAESTEVVAPPIAIKPEPIVIETAKDAIKKGEAYLKSELEDYKNAVQKREDLEKEFKALTDEEFDKRFPELEKVRESVKLAENSLFQKIVTGDKTQSDLLAQKIKFTQNLADYKSEIRANASDFFAISRGKGSESLNVITQQKDRAFALKESNVGGLINIGKKPKSREALFHEMGHHIEFENPKYAAAAQDFVLSRSTGKEKQLKGITGNTAYRDNETAFPDKFIDPYVGKIYKDGSTEVISMGVERFRSKNDAITFFRQDRDHFLFTVGILND